MHQVVFDLDEHDLVWADGEAVHPLLACRVHPLITVPVLLLSPVHALEPEAEIQGSYSPQPPQLSFSRGAEPGLQVTMQLQGWYLWMKLSIL